jgi:hypothetical protein
MTTEKFQEKIENRIIDFINLNSGGRLTILKSDNFSEKINLVVKKRGEYEFGKENPLAQGSIVKAKVFGSIKKKETKDVNICIISQIKTKEGDLFNKEINVEEFKNRENTYLIFVFFSLLSQDISENICILSLDEFKKNSEKTKENIVRFESFLSPKKNDKFSKFLVNKKDVSKYFINIISPVK